MTSEPDSLSDLVLEEVPKPFFQRLAHRQPSLYSEAFGMAHSYPGWSRTEAESVTPINRRALFENEFRVAAHLSGIEAHDLQHKGKNYWYVFVRAGKIGLTAHHVQCPKTVVRNACSRQQHASVNDWLDQPYIEELLQELPPRLGDADSVVAHLLHGLDVEFRAGERFESHFLRLAFPDPEVKRYIRNYNVLDLLQGYGKFGVDGVPVIPSGPMPDGPRPSLKANLEEIMKQEQLEAERRKEEERRKNSLKKEEA